MPANINWTVDYKDRSKFIFGGTVIVDYDAKELWELLATAGHLMKVHPFCEQHESEKWEGVGSKDMLLYKSGGKRIRTVTQWKPGQFLQLNVVDPSNNTQSEVSYTIKTLAEKDKCELHIEICTAAYKNIPRPIWKFYVRRFLLPKYKEYLQGVLSGFANYKPIAQPASENASDD